MRGLILSAFTGFAGFILGIAYTVQAADANTSVLIKIISVVKGLF